MTSTHILDEVKQLKAALYFIYIHINEIFIQEFESITMERFECDVLYVLVEIENCGKWDSI